MTEAKLVKEYNELRDKALAAPNTNGREYLQSFSDHDLKVFIAGKTMQHGRDFKGSWENATIHMKNRDRAIKSFS